MSSAQRSSSTSQDQLIREMERLNADVASLNIWLRTKANSAGQYPWHESDKTGAPPIPPGALPAARQSQPYLWKWKDIEPYLYKVADLCPIEETERQQLHLRNPALGGALQICNSIRVAISIYKPGDNAPVHLHTPNASRTILSRKGGYSTVEGEKCTASRGDIIFTPNGTWHGHGNDDDEPVIWMDILDWPILEMLNAIWVRQDPESANLEKIPPAMYSSEFYKHGGIVPSSQPFSRGSGKQTTPYFHYTGANVRDALSNLKAFDGDIYEALSVDLTNPESGQSAFPTLSYGAQLLQPTESTRPFRHTASTVYCVIEGSGFTEVSGQRLEWEKNDVFVVPSHCWRRHENTSPTEDAILYTTTDKPLLEKIGQYYAQGKPVGDKVVEIDCV